MKTVEALGIKLIAKKTDASWIVEVGKTIQGRTECKLSKSIIPKVAVSIVDKIIFVHLYDKNKSDETRKTSKDSNYKTNACTRTHSYSQTTNNK